MIDQSPTFQQIDIIVGYFECHQTKIQIVIIDCANSYLQKYPNLSSRNLIRPSAEDGAEGAVRFPALAAYSSSNSRYFCAKSLGEPPGTIRRTDKTPP